MSRDKLRLITELARAEAEAPSARSREVRALLEELAALCTPAPAVDRRLLRALELVQEKLDAPWTVARLAKAVGMSRAAFAKRFTAELGVTPQQHLTRKRLERAARLLATTDDALADIAIRVGYRSVFAFARAFKRHHGVAPGTYRRAGASQPRLRLAA